MVYLFRQGADHGAIGSPKSSGKDYNDQCWRKGLLQFWKQGCWTVPNWTKVIDSVNDNRP